MTRLGAVFWGGLVLASGFATFNIKYAVQGIEDELSRVRRQTIAETREIRVLSAEWAYLNQPERLAELNRNFLRLAPMTVKQLQGRVEEIALRAPPVPRPDAMPQTMIAANPAVGDPLGATPHAAPSPAATLVAAASSVPPLAAAPAHTTRQGDTAVANEANSSEAQLADAASNVGRADAGAALAEALHLLGVDAGEHNPRTWWAKAAPIATAHAAEVRGSGAKGAETPVADAAAGNARAADTSKGGAAALAEALHVLGGDIGGQNPRVRLAKAVPASLDALISKIAETR